MDANPTNSDDDRGPARSQAPVVVDAPGGRVTLGEVMLLVAGLAVGLWLVLEDLRAPGNGIDLSGFILISVTGLLGGLSLVGVPMLLLERRRRRVGRWGPGRLLWFASGDSAWLLWPPIVYRRLGGGNFGDSNTGICFAYGTPLMALYVVLALWFGGWFRRGRKGRRRRARSWRERFGLALGLAWACTGLYVLSILYRGPR